MSLAKLAFIISRLEKTFQHLVRSPPHVDSAFPLLPSLVVGSWGDIFPPFIWISVGVMSRGSRPQPQLLCPACRETLLQADLKMTLRCRF